MTFRDLAKTALSNLSRHKVRTILSAVGVTVGILTIVTMVSLGVGVQQEASQAFRDAGLEQVRIHPVTEKRTELDAFAWRKRTVLITEKLVQEMRARDDVLEVYPRELAPWGASISLRVGEDAIRVYVRDLYWTVDSPFTKPPELLLGEKPDNNIQGGIVVSIGALETLGYEEQVFADLIGREVTLALKAPRGDTQEFPLRIVGVLDVQATYGYPRVYIGMADMVALNGWWYNDPDILEHEGYDELAITAASLEDATEIVELLEKRGFEVESLALVLETMNKAMIVLETMLGSVGGLALFVASIGIANTMVMAVYERTREIGILKAIGASPGDIRRLFTAEAALIGLVGGIVGTAFGWLLGLGLNEGFLAYMRWQEIPVEGTFFVVTGWLVALALAFATVVGLLAGLYPAARAARLDPLEALRYE